MVAAPLVASHSLELGSGGYGLLLGAVGVGAVGGAFVLPAVRRTLGASGHSPPVPSCSRRCWSSWRRCRLPG
ncbi:MFS transporter [Streptomyces iakyrus]|uniref:MFS transporter n=1 Tax=Streptomyces iakyrus TaxID=68219 RepID=UPI0036E34B8C